MQKELKILTINSNDSIGGAARAAFNLSKSLEDLNIDSKMLVSSKNTNEHFVFGPKTKIDKFRSLVSHYIDDLPKKY